MDRSLPQASSASPSTSPLRLLHKEATLSPTNQTQRTRVLAALSRISAVSIRESVKEDGHRFYVIDVQLTQHLQGLVKTASAVGAVASASPTKTPRGAGDVSIKRRFSEFTNLRDEMYYHAHTGHRRHTRPCAFCATVVDFLTHAPQLPRLRNLAFSTTESMCKQLDEFLNVVLQLAITAKSHSERWCEGREMVPLLVKKFLLGDGGAPRKARVQ